MFKSVIISGAMLAMVVGVGSASAAPHATPAQAEAMVKKAVAYIKANGPEKAYAAFDNRHGQFVDGELYVFVYDLNGKVLAHGSHIKLVGKNLSNAQDVNGKYYVKERIELAKTKKTFWQDYAFEDPVTKKIEPKESYCERVTDTVVCAGIYKPKS